MSFAINVSVIRCSHLPPADACATGQHRALDGDRLGVRAAGVPHPDSRHGGVQCLVQPRPRGERPHVLLAHLPALGRHRRHLLGQSIAQLPSRCQADPLDGHQVFLLTYTYTEARSNYYRGSILILSCQSPVLSPLAARLLTLHAHTDVVLVSGFVFAPSSGDSEDPGEDGQGYSPAPPMSFALMGGSFGGTPAALYASQQQQQALPPVFSVLAAMFQSLWAR